MSVTVFLVIAFLAMLAVSGIDVRQKRRKFLNGQNKEHEQTYPRYE